MNSSIFAQRKHCTSMDLNIDSLVQYYRLGRLNVDNTYQRDYVWSYFYQQQLITSIFEGVAIHSIICTDDKSGRLQVIDGKQRLTTIVRFVNNEFMVRHQDRDWYFRDLSVVEQRQFENFVPFKVLVYYGITSEEAEDMFNRIQLGEPLSYGERVHSRTESPLVSAITNRIWSPLLANIINEYYHDEPTTCITTLPGLKGQQFVRRLEIYSLCVGAYATLEGWPYNPTSIHATIKYVDSVVSVNLAHIEAIYSILEKVSSKSNITEFPLPTASFLVVVDFAVRRGRPIFDTIKAIAAIKKTMGKNRYVTGNARAKYQTLVKLLDDQEEKI